MTRFARLVAGDHFRTLQRLGGEQCQEWTHFCVQSAELHLIVNLAVQETPDTRVGSVTLLSVVHTAEQAADHAETQRYTAQQVSVCAGEVAGRWGENSLQLTETGYQLQIVTEHYRAQLVFEPASEPYWVNNLAFGEHQNFNWFVLPRSRVRGWVQIGADKFSLDGATGYHDHNWGNFSWGADFAWEWGVVYAAAEAGAGWTCVLGRLTDRSLDQVHVQGLLVWQGANLVRAFRGQELRFEREGQAHRSAAVVTPAVLRHLLPGAACAVPHVLNVHVRARGDELHLRFEPHSLAQVVVLDDSRPALRVLHEVTGEAQLRGSLLGHTLDFSAAAQFEFAQYHALPSAAARARLERQVQTWQRRGLLPLGQDGRRNTASYAEFSAGRSRGELGRYAGALQRGLTYLAQCAPAATQELCVALSGLQVLLQIQHTAPESALLRCTPQAVQLEALAQVEFSKPVAARLPAAVDAWLWVDGHTLQQLLAGQVSVQQALLTERLWLQAPAEVLLALSAAATTFLAHAARHPWFAELLHSVLE